MKMHRSALLLIAASCSLLAQPASSFKYTAKGDEKTVEITNVNYEVTAQDELVVRTTTHSKHFIGDIGMEASTTVEAWKLGSDFKQKPLYSVTAEGDGSRTVEGEVFVISRGLEEVDWWSVYRLANGAHLFDTYVPPVKFLYGRETTENRFVGLEVPPDDVKDARLKDPHVVGVITYASQSKVIREALITCDDPRRAELLRSFADVTRTLTESGQRSKTLRLSFTENSNSPPPAIAIVIPIGVDDLDIAHAQLPPRMHIAAWKR